ncbi:MAG: hypothetical protein H7Y59_15175 [Anaerolineales bacterium]|nr:hypothetical protein [Anaerolineales bacterium]
MMQIIFERTGGIMGRKVSVSLDLDEMPSDQSTTLRRLVDESDLFTLDEEPIKTSRPDEFIYTITITTKTIQQTVRASDTSLPESLRPLLNELLTHTG